MTTLIKHYDAFQQLTLTLLFSSSSIVFLHTALLHIPKVPFSAHFNVFMFLRLIFMF